MAADDQSDDALYAQLTGAKPARPKAASAPAPDAYDMTARYLLGEAAGEPDLGQQAAAAVAKNVAGGDINKIASVIGKPGFSSAWSDPETRKHLLSIPTSDPAYQRALTNARYILNGTYDPTGGAVHYLNPDLYAKEYPGKALPEWAQGNGQRIGNHVFYGGQGDPNQTGYLAPTAATGAGPGAGDLTDAQLEAAIVRSDPDHTGGGAPLPPAKPNPANVERPGLIYSGDAGALGAGGLQGLRDVSQAGLSPIVGLNKLAPGLGLGDKLLDIALPGYNVLSHIAPAYAPSPENLLTAQKAQTAAYQADPRSNTVLGKGGRFGAQLAATAPVLGAGGEALGAAAEGASNIPVVGNLLKFAAGEAGAPLEWGSTRGQQAANAALRLGSKSANNALQGAAANAMTGNDPTTGAVGGAVLGPVAERLGAAGANALDTTTNRLMSGQPGSEMAALAQRAIDQYGIPLRAGQISQNAGQRYLDSELVKAGPYAKSTAAQNAAFSKTLARTIGEDADGITPEVMSNARSRIGNVFDTVAQNTTIPADDTFRTKLGQVYADASRVLGDSELAPLGRQIDDILGRVDENGNLTGDAYQALTRKNSPLDRLSSGRDPKAFYGSQLRDVLDDGLEANAHPDDLAALRGARLQWKNMRTIQDLASKASPDGEVSPGLLFGAVKKSYSDMPYTGAGEIGDLANIGRHFLKDMPDSGTAGRINAQNLLKGALLPFGLGGATEMFMHDPGAAMGVAGATLGLGLAKKGSNALTAAALDNPIYRAALLRRAEPSAPNPFLSEIGQQANRLLQPIPDFMNRYAPVLGADAANQFLPAPAVQ